MGIQISKPSSILSYFINQYWTIESNVPRNGEHTQRIIPCGLSELSFYFEDKPISSDSRIILNQNTILSGQLNGFYDIKIKGKLSLFSIIFKPHGTAMFFDIPLGKLRNRNVPLRYILKDEVDQLETKLYEAKSFEERILIAEKFLMHRLNKSRKTCYSNRILNSIQLINQSKGLVSIDILVEEACLSRKQFERTFSDIIGLSPKQFLRVIRFQNAIYSRSKNKDYNLTSLAYQCGYYDQSHMTNDFLKLSGLTPKQYFRDYDAYSDYFD